MWFENSVFYQIYPLGACGCPFENDGKLKHRLCRLEDWIEPLKKEGFNAILFNPLFQSSTHGYNTIDFRNVDVRLGENEDLKKLCDKIHEQDMKVVFDGVFNHVGRDFIYFQDVLKNREQSPYKDWFEIDFNGNNSYQDNLWYACWEGHEELVKLNLKNPEVVNYLLETIDFWKKEFKVDGLRLDVAYCLDRDFLKTLHSHCKKEDPEFFLMGEMIGGDYNTICNEEMLDSVTNYECRKGIYSSFNSKNFFEILYSFNRQFGKEPWCLYRGKHLLSFVDNHDVNRIASELVHKEDLPLVYAMLMSMPGIPCIYYGSEWGLEGVKNQNDTSLRPSIEKPEENELTKTIEKLMEIHRNHPALSLGDYSQIALQNQWCIYQRQKDEDTIWAAFNISDKDQDIPVNGEHRGVDLMTDEEIEIPSSLHIPAHSFKIIQIVP